MEDGQWLPEATVMLSGPNLSAFPVAGRVHKLALTGLAVLTSSRSLGNAEPEGQA